MASPDTIILLIVDYHAAVGEQDPRAPPPSCLSPNQRRQSIEAMTENNWTRMVTYLATYVSAQRSN